ncbi:hypothetical protein [Membranihabitans marinus]|uniref:hypothetical protein n=1 Tax=Membranihabitans marinus TaxID=1227546 RepID=UPI001F189CEF|nr:hypothetical protein [Membranihabitans marinus]
MFLEKYILFFCFLSIQLSATETYIGMASNDMTPPLPLALGGQMHLRIANEIESPLTASVLLIEHRENGQTADISVFAAVELVVVPNALRDDIRNKVKQRFPHFVTEKIIVSATHTHTAPEVREGRFILPPGVTSVEEVRDYISEKVVEAIVQAYETRSRGSMTWGLGHGIIAQNRRAVYYDGSAKMYGKTNLPEFKGIEGYEDHDIDMMFFWNDKDQLIGTSINLPCPAQEVEGRSKVNADFWYPIRQQLKEKWGENLVVMGWIGAAGDQSPHLMYNKASENRMLKLRNISRLEELARRVVTSVVDVYDVVKDDRYRDVVLQHEVKTIGLPRRLVTVDAVNEAKQAIAKLEALSEEEKLKNYRLMKWHGALLDRYEKQKINPHQLYETEIHIIRLGDVVICSNQFELFTEYGIRMKARSKALQTFIIQLAGPGTYLPTVKAVQGGHYSAIIQSNEVGPEAGDILVEETLQSINSFWNK